MLRRFAALAAVLSVVVLLLVAQERGARVGRPEPDASRPQGRLALVVGVDQYPEDSGFSPLRYAHNDAVELSNLLSTKGYEVTTLLNEDTRGHEVLVALQKLLAKGENGSDTVLFAFSGHGAQKDGVQYLATWDTKLSLLDLTGVQFAGITQMLERSRIPRKIMFVDACRNDPSSRGSGSALQAFDDLNRSTGIRILNAAAPKSYSYEDPAVRHGVFTYFLLKGLRGEAATGGNGPITFGSLSRYVRLQMDDYSRKSGRVQQPYEASRDVTGDFVLIGASEPRPTPKTASTLVERRTIDLFAGTDWTFDGDGKPALDAPLSSIQGVGVDDKGQVLFTDVENRIVCRIDGKGVLHVLAGTIPGVAPVDGVARGASVYLPHQIISDTRGNIYFVEDGRVRKITVDGALITVAGTGRRGYSGDGGPAVSAQINWVHGIAVAKDGALYIADFGNNNVRKVDASGIITTIAGNGNASYGGDGGPAKSASLRIPTGIAVDERGNVYIADQGNGRIRKIDSSGVITSLGPATGCPTGVVVDNENNVYYADHCGHVVRRVAADGSVSVIAGSGPGRAEPSGVGGPATQAAFDAWQVARDNNGNLYIAGSDRGHVYKVSNDGKFSIVAGNGRYRWRPDGASSRLIFLQRPHGMAVDSSGNLLVADARNNRLLKIAPSGATSVIAGSLEASVYGGYKGEDIPATEAHLNFPTRIRLDSSGNLYFTDLNNHRVRKIGLTGKISTVAGNGRQGYSGDGGSATSAMLNGPGGLCLDAKGNLYIADSDNHRIRKVATDGRISTVAGSGEAGYGRDEVPALAAALNHPANIEIDSAGNLYIADDRNSRIRMVSPDGIIHTIAGDGQARFAGDYGAAVRASLHFPCDLWLSPAGDLYIADTGNSRVRKIDTAGIITTVAGNGDAQYSGDGGPALAAGLSVPRGITGDSAGNLYVAVERNRIRVIRPQ